MPSSCRQRSTTLPPSKRYAPWSPTNQSPPLRACVMKEIVMPSSARTWCASAISPLASMSSRHVSRSVLSQYVPSVGFRQILRAPPWFHVLAKVRRPFSNRPNVPPHVPIQSRRLSSINRLCTHSVPSVLSSRTTRTSPSRLQWRRPPQLIPNQKPPSPSSTTARPETSIRTLADCIRPIRDARMRHSPCVSVPIHRLPS